MIVDQYKVNQIYFCFFAELPPFTPLEPTRFTAELPNFFEPLNPLNNNKITRNCVSCKI